jgi:hypothetical protein
LPTFQTVFDLRQAGYGSGITVPFGLAFAVAAFVIRGLPVSPKQKNPQRARRLKNVLAVCMVVWASVIVLAPWLEYRDARSALEQGRYTVVEGRVDNFVPMPWSGHAQETFSVAGSHFAYSDYELSAGFNHTSSHGGPIRAGRWVRISHIGNTILKIDMLQSEGNGQ